jgi:hypothetical protein
VRIESIGLPGSGKTTLSKGCRTALRAAGHVVVGPTELDQIDESHPPRNKGLWRHSKARQSHHIGQYLSEHLDMHQFFNTQYSKNIRNIGLSLSVGADLSRSFMHAEHFDYFFVDEGFLHLGSHALLEHANWDFLSCADGLGIFLDSMPRPDAVIYPKASVETATSGIFRRMPDHSDKQAQRRFKKAFGGAPGMRSRLQLIDTIVKRLKYMGIPVITVAAHSQLDNIVDVSLSKLQDIQGSCGVIVKSGV